MILRYLTASSNYVIFLFWQKDLKQQNLHIVRLNLIEQASLLKETKGSVSVTPSMEVHCLDSYNDTPAAFPNCGRADHCR